MLQVLEVADVLWALYCFFIKSKTEVAHVSKTIDSCFHLERKMHARNLYFLASEGNKTECVFSYSDGINAAFSLPTSNRRE